MPLRMEAIRTTIVIDLQDLLKILSSQPKSAILLPCSKGLLFHTNETGLSSYFPQRLVQLNLSRESIFSSARASLRSASSGLSPSLQAFSQMRLVDAGDHGKAAPASH